MYSDIAKHQKWRHKKYIKKHITAFLEARYRGVRQSTTKNAQAVENVQITAHSASTNPKRTMVKKRQL